MKWTRHLCQPAPCSTVVMDVSDVVRGLTPVITLEDWALIRRLYSGEGLAKAEIARQLGVSRNTVGKAIASAESPSYSRAPRATSFTPFEQQVRQLLLAAPSMPATVLAERVGWPGSAPWFRQNVAAKVTIRSRAPLEAPVVPELLIFLRQPPAPTSPGKFPAMAYCPVLPRSLRLRLVSDSSGSGSIARRTW